MGKNGILIAILVLALVNALLHGLLIGPTGMGATPISGFFLVTTILFLVGGLAVACRKVSKLAVVGLLALSIIDEVLLVLTRTVPTPFFGGRILAWSVTVPPSSVEVLILQLAIIILTGYALTRKK